VDNVDFVCFNVYLHDPKQFAGYLARLQTLADAKPLILGEFGMDSIREGEAHKCEFLAWQIELAFRAGLAGTVVFSYTDDWWRGGMQITDWGFGLTARDRQPKDSFRVVQRQYRVAPHFSLSRVPKVSVVVATYNGSRTLQNCLESLGRLNYDAYEVILVDDGSTDRTPEIAKSFPSARYLRQTNQGLSAARNAGIRAATGEIVAFTDDDCRADEDWLYYLVNDLLRGDFAGIGGHNFLPPDDSSVAAAVMASPGGPAHVLLTDTQAEHIPGCNMAFYKWALEQVGMFDPVFRKAGDDVDICWRLQDGQFKIGFSPAASSGITVAPPSRPTSSNRSVTAKPRRCSSPSTPNTTTPSAAASGADASTLPPSPDCCCAGRPSTTEFSGALFSSASMHPTRCHRSCFAPHLVITFLSTCPSSVSL
jgi:hypothetical protein